MINRMSKATQRAVERLKEGTPGNTLNREEMAAIIGEPCGMGTAGYRHVRSAIAHVRKNQFMVWSWSRADTAWKCLDDAESVESAGSYNRQAARRAKVSVETATCIDVGNLNDDQRRDYQLQTTIASLIVAASAHRFRKRLLAGKDQKSVLIQTVDYDALAKAVKRD